MKAAAISALVTPKDFDRDLTRTLVDILASQRKPEIKYVALYDEYKVSRLHTDKVSTVIETSFYPNMGYILRPDCIAQDVAYLKHIGRLFLRKAPVHLQISVSYFPYSSSLLFDEPIDVATEPERHLDSIMALSHAWPSNEPLNTEHKLWLNPGGHSRMECENKKVLYRVNKLSIFDVAYSIIQKHLSSGEDRFIIYHEL